MSTSPSPNPDDDAAVSSTASSPADSAGLLGDAGPEWSPEPEPYTGDQPPASIDAGAALAGGELWTVNRVKALLNAQGVLLHGAIAVDKQTTEWQYTQADLAAIAPPLSRILNRYEPTRAAAGAGDELAVGIGFLGYAARSISQRRRALAQLDDDQAPDVDAVDAAAASPTADYVAGEPAGAADGVVYPDDADLPPIASPRRP